MRRVFLIRHCSAELEGPRRCVSKTDLPLNTIGEHQANRLRIWAGKKQLTAVYSSPLLRARQTVEAISNGKHQIQICEELREMDVGLWENMSFDEIRKSFPDDYAIRAEHPGTHPPTGGESMTHAGERLKIAISEIIAGTEGDIAVVTHSGASRGFLCKVLEKNPDDAMKLPQPSGGISTITIGADGKWIVDSIGEVPDRFPDELLKQWIFDRNAVPRIARDHGAAVAKKASELASKIPNTSVDLELLFSAAEMHDMSRHNAENHAEAAAKLLIFEGYPKLAEIISQHHDITPVAGIEAELLYLADKMISGTAVVSINQRFAESRKKCKTPQAVAAWERRYTDTINIIERYNLAYICGV